MAERNSGSTVKRHSGAKGRNMLSPHNKAMGEHYSDLQMGKLSLERYMPCPSHSHNSQVLPPKINVR